MFQDFNLDTSFEEMIDLPVPRCRAAVRSGSNVFEEGLYVGLRVLGGDGTAGSTSCTLIARVDEHRLAHKIGKPTGSTSSRGQLERGQRLQRLEQKPTISSSPNATTESCEALRRPPVSDVCHMCQDSWSCDVGAWYPRSVTRTRCGVPRWQ